MRIVASNAHLLGPSSPLEASVTPTVLSKPEFERHVDAFDRVVYLFAANANGPKGSRVFAAPAARRVDGVTGLCFAPDIDRPARGRLAPIFFAEGNSKGQFVALPNVSVGRGVRLRVAANGVMNAKGQIYPFHQTPLDKHGWPLFVGAARFADSRKVAAFIAACDSRDERGDPVFVRSAGLPVAGCDAFFVAHQNAVDREDSPLFIGRCEREFDGVRSFVAPFNFLRRTGDKRGFPSCLKDLGGLAQNMRDLARKAVHAAR